MKKYIYITVLSIVSMFFSSCENDSITISHGVPIKVDPSSVIAPFTYEVEKGELSTFDSNSKLRIRLLAYDGDGKLVAKDSVFLSSYAGIMNSSLILPEGSYTLVAITDMLIYDSDSGKTIEFWKLSGENDINNAKVTDVGYLGLKYKILGAGSTNITVTGETLNTINISPTPVGALLIAAYDYIHDYKNITEFCLLTNRSSDYMTFDSHGKVITIPSSNDNKYDWYVSSFDPRTITDKSYHYDWNYVFPTENVSFKFFKVATGSEDYVSLTKDITISKLEAGGEYMFHVNFRTGLVDGGRVNKPNSGTRSLDIPNFSSWNGYSQDKSNSLMLKGIVKYSSKK